MRKKILVVDDSSFDRSLALKALSKKGNFSILEAPDGEECMQILSSSDVDLVLLDIMMPKASGFEVLRRIREKFNPIELPVIMVTAKSEDSDIISCLQAGANDYITKPVRFDVAIFRILAHMKLTEISREAARLKEEAAIDAMITTYHHEINNPLSIAIGCMNFNNLNSRKEMLNSALWRIAKIVQRIKSLSEKRQFKYQEYGAGGKMLKIK